MYLEFCRFIWYIMQCNAALYLCILLRVFVYVLIEQRQDVLMIISLAMYALVKNVKPSLVGCVAAEKLDRSAVCS